MNEASRQAPPPAFIASVLNQTRQEPEVKPKQKDKVLAELSTSDAWKVLKDYIQAKQRMLALQLRESKTTATPEEIGFRFLILDEVNAFAEELIKRVESVPKIMEMQHERANRDKSKRAKK